jgi:hypothetical protein
MMRAALVLLGIAALSYFALQATNTDVPESQRTATNMHAASGAVRQQVADAAASKGAWRGRRRAVALHRHPAARHAARLPLRSLENRYQGSPPICKLEGKLCG